MLETPAGVVGVEYRQEGRFVEQVRLFNVPAYLHAADIALPGLDALPGLGAVMIDVAYGGNYYAIVTPQPGWPGLDSGDCAGPHRLEPGRCARQHRRRWRRCTPRIPASAT